ncbi:MAG: glycosyltransferase family 2 protein [Candidatus Aenigmatarchaeota archaeon]
MISIVIPCFNEEKNLGLLVEKIHNVMKNISESYEIILIDDGSTDQTFDTIKKLSSRSASVKGIRLRRNFGQTAALACGFQYAKGETIITMDADLQNDPEDIPILLEKINKGYDVVSGWRINRKDDFLTRIIPSKIANYLIGKITGVKLHDYGCSLKAYRSEVIKNLDLYGELHRFIPALAKIQGAEITEVPVKHHPRLYGKSKYTLSRTFRVLLDLILVKFLLSYSTRPIHFFGTAGLVFSSIGIFICLYLGAVKILYAQSIGGRPLLLLGILLITTGIQLLTIGILSEIQIRTYFESQKKPIYAIKEFINLNEHDHSGKVFNESSVSLKD